MPRPVFAQGQAPVWGAAGLTMWLALAGCSDRSEWRPHAEMMNDPELTRLPDRQLPPPAPLRAPADRPDVTVYGYWPYWGDSLETLYWDQLTHVAIFAVDLQSNGTFANTSRWHNVAARAMQLAAPYGVRVHLCFTSFSDTTTNAVLGSAALRTTAVNNLASLVNQYGAHGVNIDIEGMDSSQFNNLVLFVQELDRAVGDVTLATPAVDWSSAYDYDRLADESDGLFIMGYDYHWGGGGPGPVAPLYGGGLWSTYSLDWTVRDYRSSGAPDSKIILGLPLYGRDWPTTGTNIPGTSTGTATSVVYSSAIVSGPGYGRRYDAQTETAYAFPTSTRQMWYDDQESIDAKIQYAVDEGLQGFGFWALTYEDSSLAFWQMVDDKTHSQCPDGDGDGTSDCDETCDADPNKTAPGACGCGVADSNADGDAWLDCQETCDTDPGKSAPGTCGCGVADSNADGDAWLDCQETCDTDPAKSAPGACGCGVADSNADGDAWLDCQETCDADPAKSAPGVCGCGLPDEDITGDGVADCTVCGDGRLVAPERCDDGGRTPGDGCSAMCQLEEMTLDPPFPGRAGVRNELVARGVPDGDGVLYLASATLGSTPVPGCPGLVAPLQRPTVIGMATASGGEAVLDILVPARAAGATFALVAIDLDACRLTEPVLAGF